jgi:hypothetical protein
MLEDDSDPPVLSELQDSNKTTTRLPSAGKISHRRIFYSYRYSNRRAETPSGSAPGQGERAMTDGR